MKNGISFYKAEDIFTNDSVLCSKDGKTWTISRPLGFYGLRYKLKALKLVWQEKADLIIWL